ncbi:MAG: ChaN family lipoprotein [Fimbriimonadales bacterium]|nr:ChaN family lipoprotein [Fimbriimonadales bacterium]
MTQPQDSVYTLAIGDSRRQYLLTVRPNEIVDTRRRRAVSLQGMVRLLEPATFILIGEQHDNAQHHQFQAQVIEGLVQAGRSVIVGMEMFDRTKQHSLNLWTLNRLSEAEFIEQSEWKTQWGFDFALYRPIFEVVYRHRLRLVGLNVPRSVVRQTARGGWQSVPESERMGIPEPDLTVEEHRKLFYALLGSGHPTGQAQDDNFYAAQVVWDTAMADTALRYLERTVPSPRLAFVILAGNGHVMYDMGISLRLRMRTNLPTCTITPLPPSAVPLQVRASIGDFVWLPPKAS